MATEQIRINYVVDKKQLDASNKSLKTTAKANDLVQKEVDQTNDKFKKQEKQLSKTNKAFAGLGGQLTALGNRFQIAGKGVGDMAAGMFKATTATGGVSKAMKVLKFAIASTGIGLLVVALGSLVSFFTKTQRGSDLLSKAMAGLGATVDVIVDRASALGESLFKAFDNPKKSIKALGDFIIDNIINRFKAVIDFVRLAGDGFRALATGDMEGLKQAATDAGQALIQLTTGFDKEQQAAIAKSIAGVTDEISKEAKAAQDLEDRRHKLREAENEFIVTKAKLRREIGASRLAVEEEQRAGESLEEANARRFKAAQDGIDAQNKLSDIELSLGREKLAILDEQLALGENLDEDNKALLIQKAALIDLDTQRDETLKRLITRQNAFNASTEESLAIDSEAIETKKSQIEDIATFELGAIEIVGAKKKETDDVVNESEIEGAEKTLSAITGVLNKKSLAGKAAAIAQVGIQTQVAATSALAPPPIGVGPVFGPILAGITIAAGLFSASKIAGINPKFEKGGRIGGNLHSGGGTMIEAERDEFMMSRKATNKYGFDLMNKINNLELNDLSMGSDGASINIIDTKLIAEQLKNMPQNIMNVDSEGFALHQRRGQYMISQKIERYST